MYIIDRRLNPGGKSLANRQRFLRRAKALVRRANFRQDGGYKAARSLLESPNPPDALFVANGHHWDPRWPEPAFPGSDTFEGEQIHAHDYRSAEQLAGLIVEEVTITDPAGVVLAAGVGGEAGGEHEADGAGVVDHRVRAER